MQRRVGRAATPQDNPRSLDQHVAGTPHRGLLQVSPEAAQYGGLGNGKGNGQSDTDLQKTNPDYINGIWDPATNIHAGTGYLNRLIETQGDVREALKYFRGGKDPSYAKAAENYANNILDCSEKVKAGDFLGGLGLITN